jgi:hypothetical protein
MKFEQAQIFVIRFAFFALSSLNAASKSEIQLVTLNSFLDAQVENRQKIEASNSPIKEAALKAFDALVQETADFVGLEARFVSDDELQRRVNGTVGKICEMKKLLDALKFAQKAGLILSRYVPYQSFEYCYPSLR